MTGTIILWFGWYGFNAGSTLCIIGDSCSRLAAKVAVMTTLSAAGAVGAMILYQYFVVRIFDLPLICNSLLAGLVSITASCAVVNTWGAFIIGIVGCLVYVNGSHWLQVMEIDDPLDVSPIHGECDGLLS